MSDLESLDQFHKTLTAFEMFLKEYQSDGGFWPSGRIPYPDSYLHTQTELANGYELLHRLKSIQKVFCSLPTVLEGTIGRMQETLLRSSYHHGLMSLPTEVLTRIIELLCAERYCYRRAQMNEAICQLSLVSKAFRAAVLDTVSLWTRLDDGYCSHDGFDTRISRTKDAPLTLSIDSRLHEEEEDTMKLLSVAFPFRERFRKLRIHFPYYITAWEEVYLGLDFPQVEEAVLYFPANSSLDEFTASWTFPKLKKLEIFDTIPTAGFFTDLTEFKVRTTDLCEEDISFYFFKRLIWFLSHQRCLQTLSLDFRCAVDPSYTNLPSVVLHTVKSFFISSYDRGTISASFLGVVFRAIQVPNAEDVRLRVHLEAGERIADCIESFSSAADAVQKVSYLGFYSSIPLDARSMARFLDLFRNVRVLELKIKNFTSSTTGRMFNYARYMNLDRLRKLIVDNDPPLKTWVIEGAVQNFTNFPEEVEMVSKSNMSSDFLDDEEPSDKFGFF